MHFYGILPSVLAYYFTISVFAYYLGWKTILHKLKGYTTEPVKGKVKNMDGFAWFHPPEDRIDFCFI